MMSMGISNNTFQRNANISLVAQLIWRHPGISRIDIARKLHLYRSTVTNIIQILLDAGIVYESETGDAGSQGGRRPILLKINEKMGCVIGLELQPDYYRAVIVDVYGTILHQTESPLSMKDLSSMFNHVMDILLPIVESVGMPLLGICVGLPGIVNPDKGIIILSDPFHLNNYPFMYEIARHYPVPVMLENDVNCCAWEDLTLHRDENLEDFLIVLVEYHDKNVITGLSAGMGVGLGVALGGKIYYGKRYAAGEFTSRLWRPGEPWQFDLSDELMNSLSREGDAYCEFVYELFESFKPLVSVFDPEALFLHGDICMHKDLILSIYNKQDNGLQEVMERVGCHLEFSNGGKTDVAHGAASMFLSKLFSVPELTGTKGDVRLDWDEIFALVKNGIR